MAWSLDVPDLAAQKYRDTRGQGASGFRALVDAAAGRMDAKGTRDRAVLRLLFDCALRRAEVVSLKVAHYDVAAARSGCWARSARNANGWRFRRRRARPSMRG